MYPQHHKPPDGPAIAHVGDCRLARQLSPFKPLPWAPSTLNSAMHHNTPTPQHRSTASHTARTPQNTPQHHNPSNWRKCTQMWQARDTNTRPISSTHNYPQHTTRALTHPAATIITPELSPYTATGVDREVSVLSPSCAAHKASQPLHKPAHPTSRSPLRPSPQNTLPPVQCR